MSKINDCIIQRTPVGCFIENPDLGFRFPVYMDPLFVVYIDCFDFENLGMKPISYEDNLNFSTD